MNIIKMKNQEILDDDQLNDGKEVIDKRTHQKILKALIYFSIMLIISFGLIYSQLRDTPLNQGLTEFIILAIGIIIVFIIVSFILEFFRFLIRKFKSKKSDVITLVDPFWFQIIEGAFAIWILFTVIKIIQLMMGYGIF
ncbi:MAG: hypothetical protein ACI85O_000726 [Saprospiraceae bacterium]|jgi:hypothetical protein